MESKVAIITGASSGIGEATAKTLASFGINVVIGARREERLMKLTQEIRSLGGIAEYKVTDVTQRKDMDDLVRFTKEKFTHIDIIVNNAGVMPQSPLRELKYNEWNQMVDVNLKGTLNGIGSVLPDFYKNKAGHIITIASTASHRVNYGGGVYSATKYGVRALMETLRLELATDKVHVRATTISPGATDTELLDSVTSNLKSNLEAFYQKNAISPQTIADAILYAIKVPENVSVNEIIMRATDQDV